MRDGLRAIDDAGPGEDELAAGDACGQPAAGRGGDGKYDLSADDRISTAAGNRNPGRGDDLPAMRITLHSPLDCPGCGSRFDGAWSPGKETADQACPCCAQVFTATWKGWTFTPEQVLVT